ncbi:cysteine and histidine-rich domain-containing protein RAR1 isoform X1 [Silene latifolia]|uniref:cysteine and histidine-rich domain-containing protein RAR1 isoform X1 n=2 Tax=Silene latifolia TaxID=37657 RepID=UPI003D774143
MLRCQRIGCDATFTLDDNPEGSCRFHDSPLFHDGMKQWSCCKKRSHDFSLFLEIPGCKTGKHTTEKPVITKAAPRNPTPAPTPVITNTTTASSKETCSRCKQGFFCSDHVSNPNPKPVDTQVTTVVSEEPVIVNAPPRKIVGINEPQTCKNKGCGQTFKEIDNHENACNYHPGPAVFHDRMRGWNCCDVHVKEFDEFMSIPPCTKGWHNADP